MKTIYRTSRRRILIIVLLSAWVSLVAYSKISPDFGKEIFVPVLVAKE
jgi:hypothetical protein